MSKGYKCCIIGMVLTLAFNLSLNAQINVSPYTIIGLGDINSPALVTNQAMGGIGISNGQRWYLNNMNPALLTKNTFTVLEAGMVFESRNIQEANGLTQTNSGGSISHFAMAFPVKAGTWTTSIGILPYSTVNYNILSPSSVMNNEDVPVTIRYEGEGGLTQAFFSNGVRLFKSLSVGVKASILFGSIVNETIAFPGDTIQNIQYNSAIYDQTAYKGWSFTLGLAHQIKLDDKTFINTGFTYDIGSDMNATKFRTAEARSLVSFVPITVDTLVDEIKGKITMPSAYAFGVSFEKLHKLTVGADFHIYNWSKFVNFESNNDVLVDNYGVNVGAEYAPDATSVESYLKRIVYRIGFDFQKTPFEANNQQLNDFGINFGASLPVKGLSTINLAFKFGQRGTTDNNLVKENYARVYFGVSFNDRWFQRRVLN